MSTQDHAIALIENYYAAFNRGDWEAMLSHLSDDVAHDLNQGPRETGVDAFRAFLARTPPPNTSSTANTCAAMPACPKRAARNTCCPAARSSTSATAGSRA